MDERFRQYLEKQDVRSFDRKILEDYNRTMAETVIPKITKSIRQRERHAMELRFSPFPTSDPKETSD